MSDPYIAASELLQKSPDLLDQVRTRLDSLEEILPGLGDRLLVMQSEGLRIDSKDGYRDLVTAADLESEATLTSFIEAHFPEDSILGEEGTRRGEKDQGFLWVIDPVDGTVNYAHGIPFFTISVGIVYKGLPVGGRVSIPAMGEHYTGIVGLSGKKNEKALQVSSVSDLKHAIVVTGFPYDREPILDALMEAVQNVLGSSLGLRRTGSASLDLCYLAEGRFDAYYEATLKPWDTCAAYVIARCAGATITDFQGNPYHPLHSKTLAASDGKFHEELLQTISPLRDRLNTENPG